MRFFSVLILAVVVALFIGCSSDDGSLKKVLSKGELVIGIDESYPPMGFRDEKGDFAGFDVDLAAEVCSRLGVKLKVTPILWSDKEQELNSGKVDCIWNGMSIDSARASSMNLSNPYLKNSMFVVVKDSTLAHFDSLKGKVFALQNGSTAQTFFANSKVGQSAKEAVAFKDNQKALAALDEGRVDAVYLDEVFVKYWLLKKHKGYSVLRDPNTQELLAVGFRKQDQTLRDAVNGVLTTLKKDGRFIELSTKWFGE